MIKWLDNLNTAQLARTRTLEAEATEARREGASAVAVNAFLSSSGYVKDLSSKEEMFWHAMLAVEHFADVESLARELLLIKGADREFAAVLAALIWKNGTTVFEVAGLDREDAKLARAEAAKKAGHDRF